MINIRSFLFASATALSVLGLSAGPSMAQICYTQGDVEDAQMTVDAIGYELADAESNYEQALYWAGAAGSMNDGELWWVFDREKQQCNAFGYGHSNSCYLDAQARYEADMSYWGGERDWWSGRVGELQSDRSFAQADLTYKANNMCPA